MKNFDWKSIAELIGVTAIVASLIFVGIELKQSRDVAMADVHQSRAELGMQLATWPRNSAVEMVLRKQLKDSSLDSVDRQIIDSVYEESVYFIENNHYQFQLGLLPQDVWNANLSTMASWMPNDQDFLDYWSRNRHRWSDAFAAVIDEVIAESQRQ